MQRDLREHPLYREAESIFRTVRQPGSGQICDAFDLDVSPDGTLAVFAGALADSLETQQSTRICLTDLRSGDLRVLTFGPNDDRAPKFSPDGRCVAFLSDRHHSGDFQLYLLDMRTGAAHRSTALPGWVEFHHWSPCGERVLLGVAGYGADRSSGEGAVATRRGVDELPAWTPDVNAGADDFMWRRLWIHEVAIGTVVQIPNGDSNVWEATWLDANGVAVVASDGPGEGDWYKASVRRIDIATGVANVIYEPRDQIGVPAATPSGQRLAFVESVCSDRGMIAGDLLVIETASGALTRVDTRGVDVSYVEWQSEQCLLIAGHRGFDIVVATYDSVDESFLETWASKEVSSGGFHVAVSGIGSGGDCALLGEGFRRAPHVAVIRKGEYSEIRSFDLGYERLATAIDSVDRCEWRAPDGLEIQGWLLRPTGSGPHPVVMYVHGGPVWQFHPFYLGRRGVQILMLLRHGYAVFFPNPRGSTGRGQAFARAVVGDMGGKDAMDCLSGLDDLVKQGIADPRRLGVTGVSYGGFLSCWLVTQDDRFAAAVPVAPITNHLTEHLLSNIPHFSKLFLVDDFKNLAGQYYQRSPVLHAHKVRTPVMTICGAKDRCTPPEEASQFHGALLEKDATSVLITYPEEGHGIRGMPAAIDFAARLVLWFEMHMARPTPPVARHPE